MTLTFNDLRPQLPFIVQQVGTMVQIKPFAGYYTWLDWFDLAAIDPSAAIAELTAAVEAAQSAADAAGVAAGDAYLAAIDAQALALDASGTAIDALNDAATAQAAADAAQSDADAALAAAGSAVAPTFGIMFDEAVWNVTPTRAVNTLYPYNYGVFTLVAAAAAKKFMAQAGTWDIHILTYKGSNAGRLTVDLDASTLFANLELYVASPAFAPYLHTITGVTITGNGWHTMNISCSSKHTSSASFGLLVFKIWGERTGA